MTYRLPLFGAAREPDIAAEPIAEAARRAPAAPLVSLVAAMPEAEDAVQALALACVEAAHARGVAADLRVLRRVSAEAPAAPLGPNERARWVSAGAASAAVVPVAAESAHETVEALADALASSRLVVTIGADVPAFLRPRFALLVDRGASLVGYTAAARVVRGRFDAVLPEARPAVVRAVIARLLPPEGSEG
jgi:hypothetical protein